MSRVGKHPVTVPKGVSVNLMPDSIEVKGPKGSIVNNFRNDVIVKYEDDKVTVAPKFKTIKSKALWGTTRKIIANMVQGVTEGFVKTLEINGVGFKAAVFQNGKALKLSLGFSHDILYIVPEGVEIVLIKPTVVEVRGVDCQIVGQVAAEIRQFKKPEPFKGKGIKYSYEVIYRKEGKKK